MNYVEFILENGEAWLQYAVKVNVLGESKDSLNALRKQALAKTLLVGVYAMRHFCSFY